jgi:4-hydroxy-2-oxoheptanedioate aldolase
MKGQAMQTPVNHFKRNILAGTPQIGIWSALCSNVVADILATAGYDWALIDMEHSPNELSGVLAQLQVYAGTPTQAIVRPPWNEPVLVKRLLDIGANTLLFPMVQSAAEAEAAVRACRYPPRGIRGVSLSQRANRYGAATDYLERVEEELCVLVQIETRAALDRAAEIAAVEGVDGVFFGPADISADMGLIGKPTAPEVAEAIAAGAEAVAAAGKPAGILVPGAEHARRWLEAGFLFVAGGVDQGLLAAAARALRAELSGGRGG